MQIRLRTYPCDHRFDFMDFFGAFLEQPTTLDPGCALAKRHGLPVLRLPKASDLEPMAKVRSALRQQFFQGLGS